MRSPLREHCAECFQMNTATVRTPPSGLPLQFTHRDISPRRKAEICLQLEMGVWKKPLGRNPIPVPLTADSEPVVCKSQYANCSVCAWPPPHEALLAATFPKQPARSLEGSFLFTRAGPSSSLLASPELGKTKDRDRIFPGGRRI